MSSQITATLGSMRIPYSAKAYRDRVLEIRTTELTLPSIPQSTLIQIQLEGKVMASILCTSSSRDTFLQLYLR
jgi:hypothetical protein